MFLPLQTSSPSTVLGQITDIIKTEIGPPMITPTVLSDKEKKRTKVKKNSLITSNHKYPTKKSVTALYPKLATPFKSMLSVSKTKHEGNK